MFAYATIGSTNFEVSVKFFDAVLATLGHARLHDYFDNGWVAYGNPKDAQNPATPLLWLCKTPFNGQPANAGNGNMVSYTNADGTTTTLSGGSQAWRNNNPGNIMYGLFSQSAGAIGQNNG